MNKNIKYCPHCGHPMARDTKFCTHCGYQFKDVIKDNKDKDKSQPKSRQNKAPIRTEHNKSEFQPMPYYQQNPPHMSTRAKIISGVIALCLAGGIGVGAIHHHDTIHQQQTTQQQNSNNSNQQNNQNNQNNNQSSNNNQPQPSNKQQAIHVLFNLMSMIQGCSQGQNQVSQLKPLYSGGGSNSSYQQMAKWCKNLNSSGNNNSNNGTSVQLGYSNFHLHKVGTHEFEETYKAYYEFTHSKDNPDIDGYSTTHKYQIVPWHTLIKKTKGDDWEIIKSNSSKNVTNASQSEVEQHLIHT